MNTNDAAQTLIDLATGEETEFTKAHTDRILSLQTEMGVKAWGTPEEYKKLKGDQPNPVNADNGQSSNPVDTKTDKRTGTQTGG